MQEDEFPQWSGKCLSMVLQEGESNHDLRDPMFQRIGGRLFVVGRIPADATVSGWNANQTGAVAWDAVRDFVLFDSYESYLMAVKKSELFEKNRS